VLAIIAVIGVAALLVAAVGHAFVGAPSGLVAVNDANGGNAPSLAVLLFSRYVIAFEATAVLVVTAALGAMVLAHRDRLGPRRTQAEHAAERMRAYATTGAHPGARPSPGVYARHNSVDYPALLPDGSVAPASVSAALQARGQSVLDPAQLARPVIEAHNELVGAHAELTGETVVPVAPVAPPEPIERSVPAALPAGGADGEQGEPQ
jgi:NADH-quinone oxidoreductase subunit J